MANSKRQTEYLPTRSQLPPVAPATRKTVARNFRAVFAKVQEILWKTSEKYRRPRTRAHVPSRRASRMRKINTSLVRARIAGFQLPLRTCIRTLDQ